MNDERLPRDEHSLMSRLLEAGDRDEPPPKVVRRTLVAVGLASAVSGATGTASAGAASSGTIAILKWLTLGVVAGTSVTVGGGAIIDRTRARHPSSETASVRQPAETAAKPLPVSPPPAADTPEPEVKVAEPAQKSAASLPVIPPVPSATPDTLSAEAALIERAGSAIRSHNGTLALTTLREYQSRFPRGRLYPEATVLEVEALLLNGQREQARDVARRFLAAHPESPSAKRLRTLTGLAE